MKHATNHALFPSRCSYVGYTSMISLIGTQAKRNLYMGVVFSFMGLLQLDCYHFYIFDDFEGNANISVAIKSSSTV